MEWDQLINNLKSAHLYPVSVIKNGKTVELHINCSPLIKDSAMKIAEDVCGKGYSVSWMGNDCNYMLIKSQNNEKIF